MKKQALFSLVFLILLVSIVSASIDIRIDTKDFFIGDTIKFDYTFLSNRNEEILYTPTIKCIDIPESLLATREINLRKDIPATLSYEGPEVTDETISQQCLAIIKVTEPFRQIKEEVFNIDALLPLSFLLETCKDINCEDKSKTFIKNKKIFIDYISSVENPSINAKLTYPDKTTEELTLPTSIKASQIGTYELEVAASKETYKSVTKKEQFGVIEEEAYIPYAEDTKKVEINLKLVLITSAAIIILIIIGFEIYRRRPL